MTKRMNVKVMKVLALVLALSCVLGTSVPFMAYAQECPHYWSEWEFKEATPFESGYSHRTCYYCHTEEYQEIPKTEMNETQKAVVKRVTTYLKAAKKYNIKKMNQCFAKTKSDYGYPTKKTDWVFKKYNFMIGWEFKGIEKINNKKYKVRVNVTRPDLYKHSFNAMYSSLDWALNKWGLDKAAKHGDQAGLHCPLTL